MQSIQIGCRSLNQGCNRNRLRRAQRNVAGPHLDRIEVGMRADIPPYFLAIVYALCLDEQVDVVIVLRVTRKGVRNAGAGEVFEDLGAVALVTGVQSQPEG